MLEGIYDHENRLQWDQQRLAFDIHLGQKWTQFWIQNSLFHSRLSFKI